MRSQPLGKDSETEITSLLTCSPKKMLLEVPDRVSVIHISQMIKDGTLVRVQMLD